MRCQDVQDRDGSGPFGARKRGFRISEFIDSRFVRRSNIRGEK